MCAQASLFQPCVTDTAKKMLVRGVFVDHLARALSQ